MNRPLTPHMARLLSAGRIVREREEMDRARDERRVEASLYGRSGRVEVSTQAPPRRKAA